MLSSWRHTPFRKGNSNTNCYAYSSWRHTPFRKLWTGSFKS
ncbi:hypothetical protein ACINNAV82_2760 [Acinetobacter baumannii Naval-82]|nr:hypothetical protein ACINNAV82_2760 [Acinetobacter baumannii Naval-82]